MDTEGYLYVATQAVFKSAIRPAGVVAILNKPQEGRLQTSYSRGRICRRCM